MPRGWTCGVVDTCQVTHNGGDAHGGVHRPPHYVSTRPSHAAVGDCAALVKAVLSDCSVCLPPSCTAQLDLE
eukprot:7384594-Prymnesium_polylepis.2